MIFVLILLAYWINTIIEYIFNVHNLSHLLWFQLYSRALIFEGLVKLTVSRILKFLATDPIIMFFNIALQWLFYFIDQLYNEIQEYVYLKNIANIDETTVLFFPFFQIRPVWRNSFKVSKNRSFLWSVCNNYHCRGYIHAVVVLTGAKWRSSMLMYPPLYRVVIKLAVASPIANWKHMVKNTRILNVTFIC